MNLRREARWLPIIAVIVLVALACGAYILTKQRLESPLAERYTLELELSAVDAVTPGLGSIPYRSARAASRATIERCASGVGGSEVWSPTKQQICANPWLPPVAEGCTGPSRLPDRPSHTTPYLSTKKL